MHCMHCTVASAAQPNSKEDSHTPRVLALELDGAPVSITECDTWILIWQQMLFCSLGRRACPIRCFVEVGIVERDFLQAKKEFR